MKPLPTFFVSVKLWLHSDLCIWAPVSWSQRTLRVSVNNCPTRCDYIQFIIFLSTALHVSGGYSIHHHEHITVITASGTGQTFSATFCYHGVVVPTSP